MATHLHHNNGCSSDAADCCTIPSEFVRLRYFFGQRLGVVDLFDEQHYHAGKQRFHNLRAHGAGVLCGLTAERFTTPGTDTATTVLRVKSGAALDPCGREIIVNVDQCIDVAAWYQKHRERLAWTAGDHRLTVALCYRECPSDPAPAPRDPCGCDTGGCEFGRVREGFELKLLTDDEAEHCHDETFPTREALTDALGAANLEAALDAAIAAACPDPDPDACLCLASFTLTVGEQPLRVLSIGQPDNAIASRASLLSTAALQELVLRIAGEVNVGSTMGSSPSLGPVTYKVEGSHHVLEVGVTLAPAAGGMAPIPLAQDTFDAGYLELRRFHQNKWQNPEPIQATYETSAGVPRIRVRWQGTPQEGNYRFTIAPPLESPIVDRHMRALRPSLFAFQFSLTGNPLVLGAPRF